MNTTSSDFRQHAVVLGASMGGLLAARALSSHFARVTLVEKDPVQRQPESRKGQPQTRHVHGLLGSGRQVMLDFFPGLDQELLADGALGNDFAATMTWYCYGGYRKSFSIGYNGFSMSRPLLEHHIRERTLALPNLTLLDNASARRLETTPNRQRITGGGAITAGGDITAVVIQTGAGEQTLAADLVVDATGRGSRTPQWLVELGFPAPAEDEARVNLAYATRTFRRDDSVPYHNNWLLCTPDAPRETRIGTAFPIEDQRWIMTVGGWHGDHCPADEAAYADFVHSLPMQELHEIADRCEPLTPVITHKFPASLRRRYDRLPRFPVGLLALGDSVASFNPIYGQGMSSAALQARELDQVLAAGPTPEQLAPVFFKRTGRILDNLWQAAVGEDFRFPQTTGVRPPGTDLINRYIARLNRVSHHDEVVCAAFLNVMNLFAPPTSLLSPRIAWRVFTGQAA